ncbi:hypothetical protein EVAR_64549_1 [Eumeta japonica]|uniref:Uncharacterized protein n=1 Tax=Eumeta variegata TaxID=151549 RepID=A0A4C1ZWF0_EUMVA|nr:hypothetical protein EVAR_64549_1 [Eumeta japonica]
MRSIAISCSILVPILLWMPVYLDLDFDHHPAFKFHAELGLDSSKFRFKSRSALVPLSNLIPGTASQFDFSHAINFTFSPTLDFCFRSRFRSLAISNFNSAPRLAYDRFRFRYRSQPNHVPVVVPIWT